jgi:predicted transcriptional regulator
MPAFTVELDEDMAKELHRLAAEQERSETDIVCAALAAYVQTARPLPQGMGKYRSGQTKTSEQARDLLRQAAKDGVWP